MRARYHKAGSAGTIVRQMTLTVEENKALLPIRRALSFSLSSLLLSALLMGELCGEDEGQDWGGFHGVAWTSAA